MYRRQYKNVKGYMCVVFVFQKRYEPIRAWHVCVRFPKRSRLALRNAKKHARQVKQWIFLNLFIYLIVLRLWFGFLRISCSVFSHDHVHQTLETAALVDLVSRDPVIGVRVWRCRMRLRRNASRIRMMRNRQFVIYSVAVVNWSFLCYSLDRREHFRLHRLGYFLGVQVTVFRFLNRLVRFGLGRIVLHRLLVPRGPGQKKGKRFEGERC